MENEKIYWQLMNTLNDAEKLIQDCVHTLIELIGEHDAVEDFAKFRRSQFTLFSNDLAERESCITFPSAQEQTPDEGKKAITATVKFTMKEISQMAETFKRVFIANGLVAHILKRPSGRRKGTYYYQIRYRANGYSIQAGATDLVVAKKRFLAKTMPGEIEKYRVDGPSNGFSRFEEIFEEWHEYKHGSLNEKEWQRFRVDFESLPPKLRKMHIENIRAKDLVHVMQDLAPRKYEQMRTVFNGIFKYALASGIISYNPMPLVPFRRAERQQRESLSVEEVLLFLQRVQSPRYDCIRQGAYLMYFFGLRPCEIDEETHREGDFIITRNRKRKNRKIEYKKIPIPKGSVGLIDWDKDLTFQCSPWLRNKLFKELLSKSGAKTSYCLRHTFCTLCQETVRPDIVEIWMGDSAERLIGRVYTHFSDEFMLKQMQTVVFPTV